MTKLACLVMLAACSHATSSGTSSVDGATTDDGALGDAAADALVPIPPVCTDGDCVCDAGYHPCTGGCCPVELETATLANVSGHDVRMAYAPDGTAYILVAHYDSVTLRPELQLYARAPGAPIVATAWKVAGPGEGMFDLSIRTDGTVLIVYAPDAQETTSVQLVKWQAGTATTPVILGGGFAYKTGISTTLDATDTLWASWSTSRDGGMTAYSLDTNGTQRIYHLASHGTIEETDVQYDATRASVFSFYGHRYTGNFITGVDVLSGTGQLGATCPADSAAFDSGGHMWSVYNTYSSIHSFLCRDGTSVQQALTFDQGRIAVDGQDIAYAANYDRTTYTASWYASADNHGWTRGTLPTSYGLPPNWNDPPPARTALARDPQGRMSIVVVPWETGMGPMVLTTFH